MVFFPTTAGSLGDLVAIINSAPNPSPVSTSTMRRWQALAVRMVKRFTTGKITMVKRTSDRDPADAGNTIQQYRATQQVDAHVEGFSDEERQVDPTIHGADRKVYVAAKPLEEIPTNDSSVIIGGKGHTVLSVKAIPADGLVALYILQARTAG